MHLSNTMLDVLGTAPVEAVIIYTWSRVLHMRNRAAFYLLMSSCMLVVVLTRGDAGTGMRFAYLVFTGGVLPFLMADERPARKVFVIALMNVAIMIAEVLGTALWYGMTGIDIIDYDNTRAHLGEFAIMHAAHLVLLIALFAALRLALHRGESAGSMNLRLFLWFPVVQALLLTVPLIAGCMPAWVPACSSTACRCLRSGASSWMRCCSLRWTATLASGMRISEPRCCRVSWMRVLRSAMRSSWRSSRRRGCATTCETRLMRLWCLPREATMRAPVIIYHRFGHYICRSDRKTRKGQKASSYIISWSAARLSPPCKPETLADAMYQVVIVEDDAAQAEIIRSMIECSPRGGELAIEHVVDAESLTARLAEEPAIDVLVMDIELGSEDANGIDLVKRYFPAGCGTQVIYVTGFVEYCTSVYRTEHLYFLVKPFAQDDLDDALSRALERLEADSSKPLSVRLGSRVVLVEPSRISYIESDRRKVRIHAGAEEIEAYASLSDLSAELPASFIQCHKSFLVNMDHVKELKADSVVLSSNQVVPVSQKRRKFVREAVFSRVQSKL